MVCRFPLGSSPKRGRDIKRWREKEKLKTVSNWKITNEPTKKLRVIVSHSDGKGTWTRHRHRHRHCHRGRRIVSSAAVPFAPKIDRQRQWQLLNYFCCSLSNLQNEIETGKTFFAATHPQTPTSKLSTPTQFSLLIFLSPLSLLFCSASGPAYGHWGTGKRPNQPSPSLLNALTLPPPTPPHPDPSSSPQAQDSHGSCVICWPLLRPHFVHFAYALNLAKPSKCGSPSALVASGEYTMSICKSSWNCWGGSCERMKNSCLLEWKWERDENLSHI